MKNMGKTENNIIYSDNREVDIKSEFFSRMSHDLRTPMNAIIGLTSLTLDEADNPEAVRQNMTDLRSISDFMLSLINDILDASKLNNGKIELDLHTYSLSEILFTLHTLYSTQCNAKRIDFITEYPDENPQIITDKLRLNQILHNILSNALRYTSTGGKIEYSVGIIERGTNSIKCKFTISDTGIGMTEEFQQKLFEPFVKENNKITPELQGPGLGLAMTRKLVELMGGTIDINSKKGVGTTVTIILDLKLDINDTPLSDSTSSDNDMSGRCVLLVEDHPLNAKIAIRLLEKRKIKVVYAANGREALDLFVNSPVNTFDIVLMDIRMPVMTGLEATKAIRGLPRPDACKIPIIALTANAYESDISKSIASGMNAYLVKPIDPEILFETMAEFIYE